MHKIRTAILNGLRPSMPPSSPPFLSQLVRLCWSAVPEERPSFSEIVTLLSSKLGIEEPPTPAPKRKGAGIRFVTEAKKQAPSKILDFRDSGSYKIQKGSGPAIHERIVTLRREIKEKKRAKEDAKS